VAGFEPAAFPIFNRDAINILNKKKDYFENQNSLLSGWQDSNLRPPAPKAGAITELRYTPNLYKFVSIKFPANFPF
jgi:hypothetical protein